MQGECLRASRKLPESRNEDGSAQVQVQMQMQKQKQMQMQMQCRLGDGGIAGSVR